MLADRFKVTRQTGRGMPKNPLWTRAEGGNKNKGGEVSQGEEKKKASQKPTLGRFTIASGELGEKSGLSLGHHLEKNYVINYRNEKKRKVCAFVGVTIDEATRRSPPYARD